MTDDLRPRRSVLYMPAANERALEKAQTIAADAIINSNQPLKPEVIAKIDERLAAAGGLPAWSAGAGDRDA